MELHEAVVLSLLTGLSRRRLGDRLRRPALAAGPSGRGERVSLGELLRAVARRPITAGQIDQARAAADVALARARQRQIEPLVLGWDSYPRALEAIVDPPMILWSRGCVRPPDADGPARPSVALVGARAATAYARDVAARLGTDLAGRGVTVVSGLARGVDVAAHRGALASAADFCTVAVLGCGVDVAYPREHAATAEAIAARGAIVSEFPPGTPPRPEHFPRRNRVIAGLCSAVVVVEASARSGALITADYALDQGREVLAVPGPVLSGRNRGAHGLLRDGAKIVEDADDILEELGLPRAARTPTVFLEGGRRDVVLRCMVPGESYELDELAHESRLEPSVLLSRLLELELAGHVRREGPRFGRSASAR